MLLCPYTLEVGEKPRKGESLHHVLVGWDHQAG